MAASALTWLIVLEAFALAALPLAFRVFARMPDRGYAFAKPLGLLSVGYLTWAIGLTQTLPNSRWTVLLALLLLAGVSWLATRGRLGELRRFLVSSAPGLLAAELLFVAVFAGAVLLRASVPDVSHTEQPMDLMFLNATIASPHYPPTDPWLSGVAVSYYYLGYLMAGAVAMLTGATSSVAYNLGLATFAALGAVAAFGLTYNLVGLARGSLDARVIAGGVAAFLLLGASNLAGAMELVRAMGAGTEGFWEFIGIEGLTAGAASTAWHPDEAGWWWWRASRVVPGAITEFPAFSFILGDMHPHVMSIPFLLLAAGIAAQTYLQRGLLEANALREHWPLALTAAVATGSLGAINLWDLPVGLTLVGGAVLLNAARNERRMQHGRALALAGDVLVVGAAGGYDEREDAHRARLYAATPNGLRLAQRLEARGLGPDADFGAAVAASAELVAVGAPRAQRTGVVCLYAPLGGAWAQRTTLRPPEDAEGVRGFGRAVGVAPGLAAAATRDAAYVYRETAEGWELEAELPIAYEHEAMDAVIALDGETLAVAAPTLDGGTVRVYRRADGAWTPTEVTAESTGEGRLRRFGASVALRGAWLAVGAEGAVAVFRRSGESWEFDGMAPPPHASASFGQAVGIDGQRLVVGTNLSRGRAPSSGMAHVFERTDEGWAPRAELRAEDAGPNNLLGSAVAIDGESVAMGAPGAGPGSVFLYQRTIGSWRLAGKAALRWPLLRTLGALAAFGAASVALVSPFLVNFESAVNGVLPLREIATRPAHLFLLWGFLGFLALPTLLLLLRQMFRPGTTAMTRLLIASFAAFGPVFFWLQPVYGPPVYALVAVLFGLRLAGMRLARADEALFAYNPRLTLIAGSIVIAAGLLWDGVVSSDRGANGELLALDRLLVTLPMAAVIALSVYGAWTLAHQDSEAMRQAGGDRPGATSWDGHAPALLVLAVASALVMGIELFHVSDVFGGDLRRSNTVFKLSYQAWILLAPLGAFGLWFAATRFDRRALPGRAAVAAWTAVLVIGFAAVSYYGLAGLTTRTSGDDALRLDGLGWLEWAAPADAELIRWVRANAPRDAVILEGARVPCGANPAGCDDWDPALGRVASSTGRPTIIGWAGHEIQWRSDDSEIRRRQEDVHAIYASPDAEEARGLLDAYGVDYVIVGPRERAVYGEEGAAKFGSLGDVAFTSEADGGGVRVYRVGGGGA